MAATRYLFSMFLALALCAKVLLACDPAFAMPVAADAASHCDMTGEPAHSPPTKSPVKPACMIGCPAIVAPSAEMAQPYVLYQVQLEIPHVDDLDGLHIPPAIPPPRLG